MRQKKSNERDFQDLARPDIGTGQPVGPLQVVCGNSRILLGNGIKGIAGLYFISQTFA